MSSTVDSETRLGRPSGFTPELGDLLCELIATTGKSLRTICQDSELPNARTVFRWLRQHPDFCQQYTRARTESVHLMGEDAMDIADEGTNDWMENNDPKNPGWLANGEHIQRSRLRVETRKWFMSRLAPKLYGDKIDHTHAGPNGGPIQFTSTDAAL